MLKIYSKIIERCGSFELSLQRLIYRVVFLTGPPLKMSLDWPPPNVQRSIAENRGEHKAYFAAIERP